MLGYSGQIDNHRRVSRSSYNDACKLFRAMLRELRREKGITQEALAELLGMPQSYVSKYELGERRIDLVEAYEICCALDTDFVAFVQKLIKSLKPEGGGSIASPRNSRRSRR